jgi:hypothetical protein
LKTKKRVIRKCDMLHMKEAITAGDDKGAVVSMTKAPAAAQTKELETAFTLDYWPDAIRFNPRREMDLPRLIVPMFGPVGPAYVEDPFDPAGTAD